MAELRHRTGRIHFLRRWLPAVCLLLVACPPPTAERAGEEGAASADESPESPPMAPSREPVPPADRSPEAPLWRREGLEAQPRMARLRATTPSALEFEPGTTPWQPLKVPPPLTREGIPPEDDPAGTPGGLLLELARALAWTEGLGRETWEQTMRVWEEEGRAVAVLLEWGFLDDAIAGRDLRVHMARGRGGWYVDRLEQRWHCLRRVTPEGLCL